MDTFMNTLNTGLSAESIWGQIAPVAGLIITVTLVALGVYVVNKNLRKVSRNKPGQA